MIPQSHFLILGAILFCIGIFGALTRRSIVGILMSVELILNAACINFVVFDKFQGNPDGTGQIFVLLAFAIAAATLVVGLALVIAVYRTTKNVSADQINLMKW